MPYIDLFERYCNSRFGVCTEGTRLFGIILHLSDLLRVILIQETEIEANHGKQFFVHPENLVELHCRREPELPSKGHKKSRP